MANTSFRQLREIQESVQAVVMNPSLPRSPERLDIYGEAYFSRILESLSEDFPIVKALSGETAFSRLVADYLHTYPSQSFTLGQVGHRLPTFIECHQKFQDMPVIAAVAKAEWTAVIMLYSNKGNEPVTIESTWPLEKLWILRDQPLDVLEGEINESQVSSKFELKRTGANVHLKAVRSIAVRSHSQSVLSLLTRLSMGVLFAESGYGKLKNLKGVIQYFDSLGIPYPELQAPFVSAIELLAGLALVAGFFTRLSAMPLAAIMLVALATAKAEEIHSYSDLLGVAEFSYLLLLLWLTTSGGGKFAVDQAIKEFKLPKVFSWGRT